MLPVYQSQLSVFNYDSIPPGYYYQAMLTGRPSQRFWHRKKFESVVQKFSLNLDVKAEIHDIAIFHHVFLAFNAHEPRFLEFRTGANLDQIGD